MFSATSETGTSRATAQRLRFCPYRPFSPFLIGASEGDDAQSPSPRHFAAVGPCDKRLKTERKRRRHTRRSFCRKQRSSSGHDASAATAESEANMRGSPWAAPTQRRRGRAFYERARRTPIMGIGRKISDGESKGVGRANAQPAPSRRRVIPRLWIIAVRHFQWRVMSSVLRLTGLSRAEGSSAHHDHERARYAQSI